MNEAASAPQFVVLDTNAALDWMVFADPGMARLVAAIEGGAVRWLATPHMRGELSRALVYPSLAKWKPDSERAHTCFDRWTVLCLEPVRTRVGPLVCSDPDDQVFIDLAIAQGARWLVTHDRALHKLARRAWAAGVGIVRPKDWRPD